MKVVRRSELDDSLKLLQTVSDRVRPHTGRPPSEPSPCTLQPHSLVLRLRGRANVRPALSSCRGHCTGRRRSSPRPLPINLDASATAAWIISAAAAAAAAICGLISAAAATAKPVQEELQHLTDVNAATRENDPQQHHDHAEQVLDYVTIARRSGAGRHFGRHGTAALRNGEGSR